MVPVFIVIFSSTPMTEIFFKVIGIPRGKARPRFNSRTGRVYTPATTIEAENSIYAQAYPFRPNQPLVGPLMVILDAFFPIPMSWSIKKKQMAEQAALRPTGKPDLDNCIKILDALNGVFWKDDAQIVDIRGTKWYSAIPRIEIKIETI